ncbi:sigma 54-interacting transcriptional regulator [Pendulispora albinea]|uniref:Sigma 54-interacting transcriptional regulator n=1 Tax=Pendulispora albinea TaxID=2741071 RepID=A0ABZ2M0Z3_9BACT
MNSTFVRTRRRDLVPSRRAALLLIHRVGIEVRDLTEGEPLTVGRDTPADVCVHDPTLSRVHARFRLIGDAGIEVDDLGSTNGTWLSGRRIERATLAVGDEVMLGGVLARVRFIGSAATGAGAREESADLVAGPAMTTLLRMARQVAHGRISVLLRGETGTGKEVLARYIHDHGTARDEPMICINCGAIPKELVESTFFGHERGAFTGAHQGRPGVFESAGAGTILLDEIGELPLPAQVALLRVLEERRVCRVGSTREIAVSARVIAATHRDLQAMVEAQTFRADLYFRLSAVTLDIPPLRQRREDIEPLARQFLRASNLTHGRAIEDITPRALACLNEYPWSGNVRELHNVIERAVVLAVTDVIDVGDLPERLVQHGQAGEDEPRAMPPQAMSPQAMSPRAMESSFPRAPARGEPSSVSAGLRERVQAYEKEVIREALAATGGNRTEAARRLGMPVRTLSYKIKAFGIGEDG